MQTSDKNIKGMNVNEIHVDKIVKELSSRIWQNDDRVKYVSFCVSPPISGWLKI